MFFGFGQYSTASAVRRIGETVAIKSRLVAVGIRTGGGIRCKNML